MALTANNCGAGAKGSKGFQRGNTCARGGKKGPVGAPGGAGATPAEKKGIQIGDTVNVRNTTFKLPDNKFIAGKTVKVVDIVNKGKAIDVEFEGWIYRVQVSKVTKPKKGGKKGGKKNIKKKNVKKKTIKKKTKKKEFDIDKDKTSPADPILKRVKDDPYLNNILERVKAEGRKSADVDSQVEVINEKMVSLRKAQGKKVQEAGIKKYGSKEAYNSIDWFEKSDFMRAWEKENKEEVKEYHDSMEKLMNEKANLILNAKGNHRARVHAHLEVPKGQRHTIHSTVDNSNRRPRAVKKAKEAREFVNSVTKQRPELDRTQVDVVPNPGRAHYSDKTMGQGRNYIKVSGLDPVTTYVHEYAHSLEFSNSNSTVLHNSKRFRRERIREAGTPDVSLAKQFPKHGYRANEVGNKDNFGKAFDGDDNAAFYTGKNYGFATEIMSMGVEKLYEDPVGFANKDPEYFKFIVGQLHGRFE